MARVGQSVPRLVDAQVLRYKQRERKAQQDSVRPGSAAVGPDSPEGLGGPMVTVSRQYGAAGGELACLLAARLGYSFFGQELVHEIARNARVRPKLVETMDERCRDRVQAWVAAWIEGGAFQPDDYLRNLSSVIKRIGKQGSGVIVGRAGHLLLEGDNVLRVRVVGPVDDRVSRVAQRHRLTLAEASARVRQMDAQREAFYRQSFGVEIGNPTQFDLIVNTGRLSLSEAADLVVSAHERRFHQAQEAQDLPSSGVRWSVPATSEPSRRRPAVG